jgi:hypothetical protein
VILAAALLLASAAGPLPTASEVLDQEQLYFDQAASRAFAEQANPVFALRPSAIRALRCRRGASADEALCDYSVVPGIGPQIPRKGQRFGREGARWQLLSSRI